MNAWKNTFSLPIRGVQSILSCNIQKQPINPPKPLYAKHKNTHNDNFH